MTEQTLTRLKAARLAQEWSAAHVVRELRRIATDRGEHPYGADTVKRGLRRWENGYQNVPGWAVGLLEQCYGLSAAELGISHPEPDTQLIEQARAVLTGTTPEEPADDSAPHVERGPRRQTSTGTWLRLLRTQHHAAPTATGVAS
ncbi:hypothetical protein [Haloactinomyces albus]|uniref:Uncharacterized protein n=1 Tax=Haloactinomyces albus TaxID=1352928 RepID=A0AAE3ZGV8_9ACTN|nr:hypothetical protein [Haloactinomyces albus]MDR7301631.1 hypothetical protein [Haloactinomyces albus]MDR7304667.1 hypothetical protein [Haloactinomyces albus]MDR7304677.1 hypothetical protein [Haloactinomyces albus]MDR7304687.1 hypothetical protein [Haloactinomyces albus]MDR7304701.1 hypothetical protein [Haloactinomyces albus]